MGNKLNIIDNELRALSIRQPYAEAILRGTKKVERRTRPTRIRGRFYIYASRTPGCNKAYKKFNLKHNSLSIGLIVGSVELIACRKVKGAFDWILANPQRLSKPMPPQKQPQPVWFQPFLISKKTHKSLTP